MSQRGITTRMVDVVSNFGLAQGDKRILNCKNVDALVKQLDTLRKDLLKLRDKGGVVVIQSDELQITAYNLNDKAARFH
jgi:hypothetical protein